jgi:drug/metabolite transporter (DMT)-like permease
MQYFDQRFFFVESCGKPFDRGRRNLLISNRFLAVVMAFSATGIWGLTDVVGKHLVGAMAPMTVILMQLGCSALISWIIVTVKFQYVEIDRNTVVGCLLGVLHPGLSSFLAIIALSHVDASIFSTIWALEAVMTMLLAWVLLAEKINAVQVVLSAVSLTSVLLASTNFQKPAVTYEHLYGMSLLFGAVLSCGIYSVLSREIATKSGGDALVIVAGQQITGLLWIGLMISLARSGVEPHDVATLSGVNLLLCTLTGVFKYLIATGLFFASLRYLSASFASSFLVLTPVFGIAAAVSFLGEELSGSQWSGILIVLLSVLAIQLTDRQLSKRSNRDNEHCDDFQKGRMI